MLIYSLGFEMC